jgi:type I restriction enzyme S subunit
MKGLILYRAEDDQATPSSTFLPLPPGWQQERLADICSIKTSSVDKKSVEGEYPVRLCNYVDVYHNDRITSDLEFMESTASEEQIRMFSLKHGDVVITKDSESPDDIGIPAFVAEDIESLVCGYHLSILAPDADRVLGRYLAYALRSKLSSHQFRCAANGVTRFGLTYAGQKSVRIAFPRRLAEQEAISDFLDEKIAQINDLISKKLDLISKLKEKRLAVTAKAVTKGLDPNAEMRDSGVPWIGQIPKAWDCANLRRFAVMKTGHTPSRSEPSYWQDCDIPWFGLADVWQLRDGTRLYLGTTKEQINALGLANSAAELLPAGTVVFSRTASVGFSGVMPIPMATTQDFWNWIPGERLLPEYLLFLFRAMTQEFKRLTMGSTHKTIYQPDAASLRICVPSLPEQKRIVAHIVKSTEKIDGMVAKVESAIARLHEYRSALITAAVTGGLSANRVAARALQAS